MEFNVISIDQAIFRINEQYFEERNLSLRVQNIIQKERNNNNGTNYVSRAHVSVVRLALEFQLLVDLGHTPGDRVKFLKKHVFFIFYNQVLVDMGHNGSKNPKRCSYKSHPNVFKVLLFFVCFFFVCLFFYYFFFVCFFFSVILTKLLLRYKF